MIIPEYLKKGDKVGVVATAKKVHKAHTLQGIDTLRSWGLEVQVGDHVFDEHLMFAGADHHRAADFQQMIDNPGIKAIFLVRGGYGSTRIIDRIDFTRLLENPKWISGFSDITAIHCHLYNLGIASIHAPMPSFFYALAQEPLRWFRELIFGKHQTLKVESNDLNRKGAIEASLVGGNLSIICHTIGTPSQIRTDGNILFIEDVGEALYNLDRMMVQLKRAGLLKGLAGLVVGQFTEMKDDDPFGLEAREIVFEHVREFDFPVAFDFPIGHSSINYAVPVGSRCHFSVEPEAAILKLG